MDSRDREKMPVRVTLRFPDVHFGHVFSKSPATHVFRPLCYFSPKIQYIYFFTIIFTKCLFTVFAFAMTVEELDSSENWNEAEAEVQNALKRAVQVIPVRKIRVSVDNARKQFIAMSKLMDKRTEVIRQVKA